MDLLSDLLLLEEFYGPRAAALFVDDLSRHHGADSLRRALRAGDLQSLHIRCGPDRGRVMLWLSCEGRKKARAYPRGKPI